MSRSSKFGYTDNWPKVLERCHHCVHYGWGNKAPWCRLLSRSIGALGHCTAHVLRNMNIFNDFEDDKEDPQLGTRKLSKD